MIDVILILVWAAVVLIGIPVQLYLFYRKGYIDGYRERMRHEELEKPTQVIRWHTMHTEN